MPGKRKNCVRWGFCSRCSDFKEPDSKETPGVVSIDGQNYSVTYMTNPDGSSYICMPNVPNIGPGSEIKGTNPNNPFGPPISGLTNTPDENGECDVTLCEVDDRTATND